MDIEDAIVSTIPLHALVIFVQRQKQSLKLSTAAQLRQTREGCIDLETPNSILTTINLTVTITISSVT